MKDPFRLFKKDFILLLFPLHIRVTGHMFRHVKNIPSRNRTENNSTHWVISLKQYPKWDRATSKDFREITPLGEMSEAFFRVNMFLQIV